jgi:Chaperone of endosialidase
LNLDSTGHLGTIKSSARYKDEIKPMDRESEAILALKPVTFRYKEELDPHGVRQFGLIAEQVEKVDPALVIRDDGGNVSTVRYEAVNAMLLNEFLKEHHKVEEQACKLAEQDQRITKQQKQIEALTATVQKVSEKIELNETTQQLVADRR